MEPSTPSSRRRKRQKLMSRGDSDAAPCVPSTSTVPSQRASLSLAEYVSTHEENMPLQPLIRGWLDRTTRQSVGSRPALVALPDMRGGGDDGGSGAPPARSDSQDGGAFSTGCSQALPPQSLPATPVLAASSSRRDDAFYTPRTQSFTTPSTYYTAKSGHPREQTTSSARQTSVSFQTALTQQHEDSPGCCERYTRPELTAASRSTPPSLNGPQSEHAELSSTIRAPWTSIDDTRLYSPLPQQPPDFSSWPSTPSTPCPPPRPPMFPKADSDSGSSTGSTVCPPPRHVPNPQLPSSQQINSTAAISAQIQATSETLPLTPLTEPQAIPTSSTIPVEFQTEQLDPGPTSPFSEETVEADLLSISTNFDSDLDFSSDSEIEEQLPYIGDVPSPIKGYHLSSDGGLQALANRVGHFKDPIAVQHFCGSPRRHRSHRLAYDDIQTFRSTLEQRGVSTRHWCVHASHTTNLASSNKEIADRGIKFVANEMVNCLRLGVPTLCVHLGSDMKGDEGTVVTRVVRVLRILLATVPRVKLALENMIRQSVCGKPWSLRILKRILDEVDDPRVMVCVDICHAFISDYDLRSNVDGMLGMLAEIGDRIAGFHVSDSSTIHGKACEGHANLGDGYIPLSAFRRILRGTRVPCYLETPNYYPSARPAHYPEISRLESGRKVAEWELLERVVCMPDEEWDGGKLLLEEYREKREVLQQRIRNILRETGALGWGVRDRVEAFRQDREVAKSLKCRVIRHGKTPSPRKSRVSPAVIAKEEAKCLVPLGFTTRGGYIMRRRQVITQ